MMNSKSPRIDRRRAEARKRIIAVAIQKFAEKGVDEVNLDEIAEEADLARGTFYSHFQGKESLIYEILHPLLEDVAARISELEKYPPGEAIDALLRLYLELWREYQNGLRMVYQIKQHELGKLEPVHGRFLQNIIQVFQKLADSGLLRYPDPKLAALVTYRLAIPLMELLDGTPEFERLFTESMKGLLLLETK